MLAFVIHLYSMLNQNRNPNSDSTVITEVFVLYKKQVVKNKQETCPKVAVKNLPFFSLFGAHIQTSYINLFSCCCRLSIL